MWKQEGLDPVYVPRNMACRDAEKLAVRNAVCMDLLGLYLPKYVNSLLFNVGGECVGSSSRGMYLRKRTTR